MGGAAIRASGIVHHLASFGHQVVVLCANPVYPRGKIFDGYKNKWIQKEENKEYTIYRTWIWPAKPKSHAVKRIFSYISFMISATIAAMRLPKQDIVIATSPSLFAPLIGIAVKNRQHIPLYLDIADIWPESANATGFMKKGIAFKLAEQLESFVYNHCDYFVPAALGTQQYLINRGIPEYKMCLTRDAADLDIFTNIDPSSIIEKYNLKNKFVVGYSGLLGFAQYPQIIVEAANVLKNNENIIFLVVGEGGLRKETEDLAQKYKLNNIIFVGEKPRAEMPYYINAFSCCLIPYKNTPLFTRTVPSKLADYLAAGKPIIINLEGLASSIIQEAKAGLVAKADDGADLAEKILYLYHHPEIAKQMGENGRKYAEQYYDRAKIVKNLETFLIKTSAESNSHNSKSHA